MARGVNQATIIGHLGGDPDYREFPEGGAVANLSIATTEKWTSKSGDKVERTEWHRVAIKSPGLARVAADYLRKGSLVYVQGKLQTRKWTDQQGVDRYTTEIVVGSYSGTLEMLGDPGGRRDRGGRGASGSAGGYDQSPVAPPPAAPPPGAGGGDFDDEIPF